MDFQNLFSVEGKVVCVTGGGGGIGRGIAGGFVAGGARVYIASRSDLSVVAKEMAEEGPGECIALRADLSKDEDIIALAQTMKEREGKLDVLVNNAALGNKMHKFGEYPMDVWDEVNAVNLRAPVRTDPGVPAAARGRGQRRVSRFGHQHRLDRRHPRCTGQRLGLPPRQGRATSPDEAVGRPARKQRRREGGAPHHLQRDRPRALPRHAGRDPLNRGRESGDHCSHDRRSPR